MTISVFPVKPILHRFALFLFGLCAAIGGNSGCGNLWGQDVQVEILGSQLATPADAARVAELAVAGEPGRDGGTLDTAAAILLVDGSRIAAVQWHFDSKSCQVSNEWGQLVIPLAAVQAIVWNGPLEAETWQRIERKVARLKGPEDAVVSIDGTVTRGTLVAGQRIDGRRGQGQLQLAGAGRSTDPSRLKEDRPVVDFSDLRIRAFALSPTLRMATLVDENDHWVALTDGSLIRLKASPKESAKRLAVGGAIVQVDGMSDKWETMLVWSAPAVEADALDSRSPLRYRHVPRFGKVVAIDSWGDSASPRWHGGKWVRRGIEVPANSRIVYRLNGEKRLRGVVRVRMAVAPNHDSMLLPMSCRFIVQTADASGKLTTRWQSAEITASREQGRVAEPAAAAEVDVDLNEASLLILGVDPIRQIEGGRAQWLEMTLAQ